MPSSSCTERSWISFSEPAARVVERREAGLVEQRAHHRRDADQLRRPGDLLAVGAAVVARRRRPQRVDDLGRHGADRVARRRLLGSIGSVTAMQAIGRRAIAPVVRHGSQPWMMTRRSSVISRTAHCGPSRVLPLSRLPPYGCWSARNVGTSFTSTPP